MPAISGTSYGAWGAGLGRFGEAFLDSAKVRSALEEQKYQREQDALQQALKGREMQVREDELAAQKALWGRQARRQDLNTYVDVLARQHGTELSPEGIEPYKAFPELSGFYSEVPADEGYGVLTDAQGPRYKVNIPMTRDQEIQYEESKRRSAAEATNVAQENARLALARQGQGLAWAQFNASKANMDEDNRRLMQQQGGRIRDQAVKNAVSLFRVQHARDNTDFLSLLRNKGQPDDARTLGLKTELLGLIQSQLGLLTTGYSEADKAAMGLPKDIYSLAATELALSVDPTATPQVVGQPGQAPTEDVSEVPVKPKR